MASNNLTARDKKLIYFCAAFAFAALAYMLVISPMAERTEKLREKLDSVSGKSAEISSLALECDSSRELFYASREEHAKITDKFSPVRSSEELDKQFTGMLFDHRLSPLSFSIDDTGSDLIPYNGQTGSIPMDEYEFSYSVYITPRDISMSFSGNVQDIFALADELNSTYGIVIRSLEFAGGTNYIETDDSSEEDGEETLIESSLDLNSEVTADISFTYYMYDRDGFYEAAPYDIGAEKPSEEAVQ
ncbi:MAG: type II secretion system protein GspM [Huintestinicola sp.]